MEAFATFISTRLTSIGSYSSVLVAEVEGAYPHGAGKNLNEQIMRVINKCD